MNEPRTDKTVTALRAAGRQRVAVELDGQPWRTLPLEAVVRAGLVCGSPLDRPRARTLARELRKVRALSVAAAALRRRDRSVLELAERLQARGVSPAERGRTLEALERSGLLDDARFARERARTLAERGSGDALIRDDLERRGLLPEQIEDALAELPAERERAEAVLARRGPGTRTARYLASRGFGEDAVWLSVADEDPAALG